MDVEAIIVKQKKLLLPTGSAWKAPEDSYLYALLDGLAISEAQAYLDSIAIMSSLIPDNDQFTTDDATDWERRLALVTNSATPLADRKAAILRKMGAPGAQPAKGHYLYLQSQLQLAGFNVFVYENIKLLYPTGTDTYNPAVLNPAILTQSQHGPPRQHGGVQSAYLNNVVVNSLDNDEDINFDIGPNLRATFFIGGPTLGSYANVLTSREIEFRQLILKLKQTQMVALLYVNYI